MERPQIVRKIGDIEEGKEIYVEDYVFAFLEKIKEIKDNKKEHIFLFGKWIREEKDTILLIFGAASLDSEKDPPELFGDYEIVGSLDGKRFKEGDSPTTGMRIRTETGEYRPGGYYVFCDTNEKMKEYLQIYYRRQLGVSDDKEEMPGAVHSDRIFDLIRAMVILIFIFLCAIAITTLNTFSKMDEFTRTAVGMTKIIEDYHE